MYATYREMPYFLRSNLPFNGNSVTATSFTDEVARWYVVMSYNTVIMEVKYGEVTYFDNSYYSTTTSKLQNILIDVFGLNNGSHKRGKLE